MHNKVVNPISHETCLGTTAFPLAPPALTPHIELYVEFIACGSGHRCPTHLLLLPTQMAERASLLCIIIARCFIGKRKTACYGAGGGPALTGLLFTAAGPLLGPAVGSAVSPPPPPPPL